MDSESDHYNLSDAGSDDFNPSPAPKKSAPKKAPAASKKSASTSSKPPKKPLAPRKSNEALSDTDHLDTDRDVSIKLPTPKKMSNGKTASQTYQKLSQLEHVLKRPDTYIGSVEKHTEDLWVYDPESKQMAYRKTTYVPGFYKIFDEILVNAADNKVRDPSMDQLKVTINKEEGSISVWNNGRGIPIEMHEKEKIYIPELIFGNLLTSSNYDDDEAKVTGGRNGYGAKLANIYSSEFVVETADKKTEQKYRQVFSDNMHTKGKPKITKNSKKDDYTCITFKPDLKRFGMESIDSDIEGLMMKRVYDMAGTVKDVKVSLNGERLKVKGFKQYVEMYVSAINELSGGPKVDENGDVANQPAKQTIIYEAVADKGRVWEVAFAVSDGEFRQVSFVNNIATIKGGKHVDHVADQVVTKLIEAVKKDKKNGPVKPNQVRQQLWVFVNCQIVNPTFDGQTKETLTLKPSAFGSKWTLTDEFAKKILKSGVIDNVLTFAKFQQEKQMKKTDGHKRSRISGIAKLEDANNAGTRKGSECTLILTEGDSAKALAVSGLTEVGRDNFGVFPLRGKLLNVREASHDQIMKNAEIKHIKEIMGLQHGKQYMSTDSLRYGSLMIMTDQDHDGSHIKGLIINFLDHFYPSLLKLPNFLVEFITPIIKATKGKQELAFFTIPEFEEWFKNVSNPSSWHIKYFKGLGTSTAQDAKKYFRAMDKHMLPFETTQPGDRELIDLAFNKKKADDRKEWLRQFKPGTYLDNNIQTVPIADFINKELILFSMADNIRSIPSMVDGLKPGQRKVLFGCFKRNLKGEIKVAQLAGYVSEHSAYHHGEASLTMTIVNLAQDFVGSNNINLLSPNGQFGTRLLGGKDAASARYIFTSVPKITRTIYHSSDDKLLNYLEEEGHSIEPEWYMPTIPQILVNGGEGIGTGWSTYVPNYNPKDIVENLRRRMAGEEMVPMKPWYRGFTGDIEQVGPDRFKVTGRVTKIDDKTYEVTELPIRMWTSSYKEGLEERTVGSEKVPATIKEYKEYHTDTTVHFVVELNSKGQAEIEAKGVDAFFKTSGQIATSNMVLFDSDGKIKKYNTPEEILDDFYLLRLSFYQKRKDLLVDELKFSYEKLSNQARFIQMVISRQLVISNRKRADIVADLRKHDFKPIPKKRKAKVAGDVDNADATDDEDDADEALASNDFDYLLSMSLYNLTKEKVDKLMKEREEKETELQLLIGRTPQNLWDEDLGNFLTEWDAILAEDERRLKDVGKGKKGGGKSGTATIKKAAKTGAAARKVLKKRDPDDDDDEIGLDDDSEDDFKPTVARKKAAATSAASKTAKPPTPKKRAASTLDDDDLAELMESKPTTARKATATSDGSKPSSPAPAKKVKGGASSHSSSKAFSIDEEEEDTKPLAPIFRKPSSTTKSTTRVTSTSSNTASKAKAAAPAKKSTTKATLILSDDDDELILPPAPKSKTSAAAAKGKKVTKKISKSEVISEDEPMGEGDLEDSFQTSSSPPPPKRSSRGRAASRKVTKYALDSEDEDDDDDIYDLSG
ncbi:type II DNA topoisomerase [Violaceomyces palustris]|uniref:Type II DNA topoisomerase n=1 Tax=Violaceomyces palustris TaxID=1673888 RepID=A0ACD0NYP5_9BASI|nr:type II DNA topoisomerase [Violaceomyces palustris]